MHSRIFQIEKKPLTKEEYIESVCIPDWFTNSIADYTSNDCDREDDIAWLMDASLGSIASLDGDKLTFSSNVRRYFKEKYEAFIKEAEKLSKTSFDDFISGNSTNMFFRMNEAYSDRYGFYVYSDDGFLDTLDNFMREVKDGDVYYIGGVVDYHC